MRPWTARRARLNHDLLSNRLVQRLTSLQRVAEGRVELAESSDDGLSGMWVQARDECRELHATLFEEMSPRALFEEPPLCHCSEETKAWLIPYVHERWMERTKAEARAADLEVAADETDTAINALLTCLGDQDGHEWLGEYVAAARGAVDRLSDALAALPKSMIA